MSAEARPVVTVLVPAFNEATTIRECLSRIGSQDYPPEYLEVIVIDGASTDNTAALAQEELLRHPYRLAVVVENPASSTPVSLNLGLSRATGSVLCRIDARSLVPANYVSRCVEVLACSPDVVVTGGRQVALGGGSPVSDGIARALRNPVVTGLSAYRRRRISGPSDTVYLGAFRTDQLRTAGGWDDRLTTNQDYELNLRMSKAGTIWFDAELEVGYVPRRTLRSLAQQYRRFGRWKAAVWLSATVRPARRQVLLLAIPPIGLGVAVLAGRRHLMVPVMTCCAGAFALDILVREPAPLRDRTWAFVASVTITLSWWLGVIEQVVRRAFGQQLVEPVKRRSS